MDIDKLSESEWVRLAQDGDIAAFTKLVTVHQKKVFAFVMGMVKDPITADDLTQQTFIKVWKGLPRFRGESAFQTWVFQVALNTVRTWGRWKSVRQLKEVSLQFLGTTATEEGKTGEDLFPDTAPAADPVRETENRELKLRLQIAVDKLPPREKAVFLLRHEQHLPLKEIGTVLGIAEGSVKAHLSHALDKLRSFLEDET